ncbi:MAG: KaiC domain-containing protein [Candidatus Aenigmatarchaeota archaeon]|nr:MAG: KaiC domain-containing protein [Candidatus Aenigmarchaeota archaeon]
MERVKSGVPGLDEILNGGVPKNQLILITGTSGTGKTILGTQFLYSGAKDFNENSVFLSFEEPSDLIKENCKQFGWNIDSLEKQGKFAFIRYDPYRIEDVFDILESTIREVGASRVLIDSISALGLYVRDKTELRSMIYNLSRILRKLNCTAMIVSEIVHGTEPRISRYGVEEFVSDSVIVMYYERIDSVFNRAMQVWKLRGSSHSQKLHPYNISKKGIFVDHLSEAFIKGT